MTHGTEVYKEIVEGIKGYMEKNGFTDIKQMVGSAHERAD
jgi:dihydroorotate dehydrogenase